MRMKFGWRGLLGLLGVMALIALTPGPAASADPTYTGDLVLGHIVLDPGGNFEELFDLAEDPLLGSPCPGSGILFEALFDATLLDEGHVDITVSGDVTGELAGGLFNLDVSGGTLFGLGTYELGSSPYDYTITVIIVIIFNAVEIDPNTCQPVLPAVECSGALALPLTGEHSGTIPPSTWDVTLLNGSTASPGGTEITITSGNCGDAQVYNERDLEFVDVLVHWN